MLRQTTSEEFTVKAALATVEERQAKDVQVRRSWAIIAVGYLQLAEIAKRRDDGLAVHRG